LFPGGYDARYWQALAQASREIARFESFVLEGRGGKRHELKFETPLPKPDPRVFASGNPKTAARWKDLPLVLSWEFDHGGARLIAVGNFWEQGECFFRLTAGGLDPAKKYVLREPAAKRVYADRKGGVALAAAEIGKGMLLHVGAMRYAFFVLEPHRESTEVGAIVRPQEMEAAMHQRLPAIQRAYRGD
jgi:hypothetical protein